MQLSAKLGAQQQDSADTLRHTLRRLSLAHVWVVSKIAERHLPHFRRN
jgi:hypothetical protein